MAFSNVASATTFSYSSYSVVDSQGLVITGPTNTTPSPLTTSAGQIVLKGSGADTGINLATWCLDLYDTLTHSGIFAISPLTTSGTGGLNPTLTGTQIGEIGGLMHYGDVALSTHTAPLGGSASDYSAAVQIAIWAIEYENVGWAYEFAPAGVTSLVSLLVTDIGNGDIASNAFGLTLAQEGNQTLAFIPGDNDLPGVPLPAALPLFATGLGGLGLLGWRRKRKVSAAVAA